MATRRERVQYEFTATDGASRVFRGLEGSAMQLSAAYRQVVGAVSLLASGAFVGSLINAGKQGEQSQLRLTAALRATGNQIGITRQELDELAESMAESTQFDDDSIRNAQGQLVKFGNIHGQVFRDAMKASADLAAFMGTDIPSAAQQVGRALQSPTEGITLIERNLGKLTEAEEKHIKTLAEQGRAVEAQNAVLAILQQRLGGTAEIMNTALTQATTGVTKAWDDMLESWARGDALLPSLTNSLGGLRDVLNDIAGKSIQDTDPFREFNVALQKSNEELTGLLDFRRRELAKFGPGAPSISMIDRRVEEIRAEQRATLARMRGMRDQAGFEGSLANTPLGRITLGGNVTDDKSGAAAAQREAVFRAEKAVELEEMAANDAREAWEAYTKARLEQDKRLKDQQQEGLKSLYETIDLEQEQAIERGQEYLDALAETTAEAERFGGAINTAFDRAVRGAESATEVVKNLITELAYIELQRRVFEPASKALSAGLDELLSGAFGGVRAGGGPVMGGRAYLVGEEGPELFVPRSSGQIVPNGGGMVFAPQIHIDSRADRAQVARDVDLALRASEARILDSFRRGGAFARAAGTA